MILRMGRLQLKWKTFNLNDSSLEPPLTLNTMNTMNTKLLPQNLWLFIFAALVSSTQTSQFDSECKWHQLLTSTRWSPPPFSDNKASCLKKVQWASLPNSAPLELLPNSPPRTRIHLNTANSSDTPLDIFWLKGALLWKRLWSLFRFCANSQGWGLKHRRVGSFLVNLHHSSQWNA